MGLKIDINKFLTQFLSSTTVYIALVSALGLLLEVSNCFFGRHSMRVRLKICAIDVTESLPDISLELYSSQYVWRKLDYSGLFFPESPALK